MNKEAIESIEAIDDEIRTIINSYSESDGIVRNKSALDQIRKLEYAIEFIEEAYKVEIAPSIYELSIDNGENKMSIQNTLDIILRNKNNFLVSKELKELAKTYEAIVEQNINLADKCLGLSSNYSMDIKKVALGDKSVTDIKITNVIKYIDTQRKESAESAAIKIKGRRPKGFTDYEYVLLCQAIDFYIKET